MNLIKKMSNQQPKSQVTNIYLDELRLKPMLSSNQEPVSPAQQNLSGITLHGKSPDMDRSAGDTSKNKANLPVFHNATVHDNIKKSNDGNSYSDIAFSDSNTRQALEFSSREFQDKITYDKADLDNPIANIEIKSQNSEQSKLKNIKSGGKYVLALRQETSIDSIDDEPSPMRQYAHEPVAISIQDQQFSTNSELKQRVAGGKNTVYKRKGQSPSKFGKHSMQNRSQIPQIDNYNSQQSDSNQQSLFIGNKVVEQSPILNKKLMHGRIKQNFRKTKIIDNFVSQDSKTVPVSGFMRQVGGISSSNGKASQFSMNEDSKETMKVQGIKDQHSLTMIASIDFKNKSKSHVRDITSIFHVKDYCGPDLRNYLTQQRNELNKDMKATITTKKNSNSPKGSQISQNLGSENQEIIILSPNSNLQLNSLNQQVIESGSGIAEIITSPNEEINFKKKIDERSKIKDTDLNNVPQSRNFKKDDYKNIQIEGSSYEKNSQPYQQVELAGETYRRIKGKAKNCVYKLDTIQKIDSSVINQELTMKMANTLQCKTHRASEIPKEYQTDEQQILQSLKNFESTYSKQEHFEKRKLNQKAFEVNMQKNFPNSTISKDFFRQRKNQSRDFKSYQKIKIMPGDSISKFENHVKNPQLVQKSSIQDPGSKSQRHPQRRNPTSFKKMSNTQAVSPKVANQISTGISSPNTMMRQFHKQSGRRQIKTQGGNRPNKVQMIYQQAEDNGFTPRDALSHQIHESIDKLTEKSNFKNKYINEMMCDEIPDGSQSNRLNQTNHFQSQLDNALDLQQLTQSTFQAVPNVVTQRNQGNFKSIKKFEHNLKQISKNMNNKNVQDEIDLVSLQQKGAKPVEFYKFFQERDQFLKQTLDKVFDSQQIIQIFGIPDVLQTILKSIIESQRTDKTSLIKYFSQQKQYSDYQMNKMKEELDESKKVAEKYLKIQLEDDAYKSKLFKGNKGDKFYYIQQQMESLEEIERNQENQGYCGPMHLDQYSGVETDLLQVKENMLKETGLIDGGASKNKLPDRIQAVPFDQFQLLMENRTSNLQKKTAFKILERFFKNIDIENKECQTEPFDEENDAIKELNQEIQRLKESSNDKNKKIKILSNEISTLQIKLSQQQMSTHKANEQSFEAKKTMMVWNSSNFELEEVEFVAKNFQVMQLCPECKNKAEDVIKRSKRAQKQDGFQQQKQTDLQNQQSQNLKEQLRVAMMELLQLQQNAKANELLLSNYKKSQLQKSQIESKSVQTEELIEINIEKASLGKAMSNKKSSMRQQYLDDGQEGENTELVTPVEETDVEEGGELPKVVVKSGAKGQTNTQRDSSPLDKESKNKLGKNKRISGMDILLATKGKSDRTRYTKPEEYKPDYGGLRADKEIQTLITGPIVAAIKPMELPPQVFIGNQSKFDNEGAMPMTSFSYQTKNSPESSPLQKIMNTSGKSSIEGKDVMAKLGNFFKQKMDLSQTCKRGGSLKRGSSLASNRGSSHVVDPSSIRVGNFQGPNKSVSPNPNKGSKLNVLRNSSRMSLGSMNRVMQSQERQREGAVSTAKASPTHLFSVTTPKRSNENSMVRHSVDQDFSNKVREANITQNQKQKRVSIPLSKKDTMNLALPEEQPEQNQNLGAYEVDSPQQLEELMAEISEQSREDAGSPDMRSRRANKSNFKVKFQLPGNSP